MVLRARRRKMWFRWPAAFIAIAGFLAVFMSLEGVTASRAVARLEKSNFQPDPHFLQGSSSSDTGSHTKPAQWNEQEAWIWHFADQRGLRIAPWGGVWLEQARQADRLDQNLPGMAPDAAKWYEPSRWGVIAQPQGGVWVWDMSAQLERPVLYAMDLPGHAAFDQRVIDILPQADAAKASVLHLELVAQGVRDASLQRYVLDLPLSVSGFEKPQWSSH